MTRPARPENVEIGRLTDVAKALVKLLAGGAIDSRSAIAALSTTGASAKQIRSARERVGVVIERKGYGRSMRSFWALPCIGDVTTRAPPGPRDEAVVSPPAPLELAALVQPDGLVPFAGTRMARRVEFFRARGLGQVEARDLARALEARDLAGSTVVSCAECQCWVQRAWCPSVRPASGLHACSSSRLDGP